MVGGFVPFKSKVIELLEAKDDFFSVNAALS